MPVRQKPRSLKQALRFLEDRRGGAAIVMALLTPILIGGLAFGAELGFWELEKRKLQNAVDTAAHAAGTQLRSGVTEDATLKTFARTVADLGGYEGGTGGITLAQPPTSGAYSGNANALRVTLNHSIPRRFSAIYDHGPVTFTVQSTALVNAGRPACVLATHPSAASAVSTGGSTNVSLTNCDIAANSISPTAITSTGNGSSVTASCISAVGNVSVNNTYHLSCPAPIANAPITADPYANVPMPATAPCAGTAAQFTQNGNPSTPGSGQLNQTLCFSGAAWNFNRSIQMTANNTYVLVNSHATQTATFGVNGNNWVRGTNVTVILMGRWNVSFNGNTQLALTAPTVGTYRGMALVLDRTRAATVDISGNNAGKIVGAIYAPHQDSQVTYTGSSTAYSAGQCTQVISGRVSFWGNSSFSTDCSNSGTRPIVAAQSIDIVE